MKPTHILGASLIAATMATAVPALAEANLAENRYINDRLVAARVAHRIRKECPTIDFRVVYAWSQARALKQYAREQGATDAQIDAYIDDRSVKDRIYGIADTYLSQQGAIKGDAESFCRVGRDEIAKNTVSGSLLSAK
ncbi:MAG: DUF5333 domain-containing protein [Paracoccus sp. (in: a-proteobacteria)]